MTAQTDPCTGFVLAGGQSTRMGQDKAAMLLQGQTLLDIALGRLTEAVGSAKVVGSRSKYGPDAIEDIFPGCGPLAGIHAALRATATDLNLVLSVDTPFLDVRFLRWIVEQARAAADLVTVVRAAGGLQPLSAVYRRPFCDVAEQALRAGEFKIDRLFAVVPTRVIEAEELKRLAFDERMFDNLNTREDFERARTPHT